MALVDTRLFCRKWLHTLGPTLVTSWHTRQSVFFHSQDELEFWQSKTLVNLYRIAKFAKVLDHQSFLLYGTANTRCTHIYVDESSYKAWQHFIKSSIDHAILIYEGQ